MSRCTPGNNIGTYPSESTGKLPKSWAHGNWQTQRRYWVLMPMTERGLMDIPPRKLLNVITLDMTAKPVNLAKFLYMVYASSALKGIIDARLDELPVWTDEWAMQTQRHKSNSSPTIKAVWYLSLYCQDEQVNRCYVIKQSKKFRKPIGTNILPYQMRFLHKATNPLTWLHSWKACRKNTLDRWQWCSTELKLRIRIIGQINQPYSAKHLRWESSRRRNRLNSTHAR